MGGREEKVDTSGVHVCKLKSYPSSPSFFSSSSNKNKACPVVLLTNSADDAYILEEEILVSRAVIVMGSSVDLPFIQCANAVRAFRVMVSTVEKEGA